MSPQTNNRQIAKNTLFLYARTIVMTFIGLYTSRVVIDLLGWSDFGVYNIVGSIIVIFSFINNTLTTGTQRYLSYELGKENGDITKVFNVCLNIHIIFSFIFLIIAETVGLWYINNELSIPAERVSAVQWIYQTSIISCIISIIRCPFNAAIISYEKMNIFAYLNIAEAILKLILISLLFIIPYDRLIAYTIIILLLNIITTVVYIVICKKKTPGICYAKATGTSLYKEIINFSKWSLFGSVANLGLHQGINVLVNKFYGVISNASIGIANQVNSQIVTFVGCFQTAINPQLTKCEASNNRERQHELINSSSRLSYFIMLFIAIPLMLNIKCVLNIWLGDIPEHTADICNCIIIGALIECLSGPLWVTIFATGKIRNYQVVISIVLLTVLPLSYICCKFGLPPTYIFIVRNFVYIFALITRLYFLRKLINLDIKNYISEVILPVIFVSVLSIIPFIAKYYIMPDTSLMAFLAESIITVIFTAIIIYTIGLRKNERHLIKGFIINKIKK